MLTTSKLEQILTTIPHKRIGLLGDLFLDRYLDIDPVRDEPSIETGLTAYQVVRVRSYPGALGTVLNNLVALGVGHIAPFAILGDDGEGYELRQALARLPGVELDGLVLASDRRTPTYTKPMYGPRELNRLDIKNRKPTPEQPINEILSRLEATWDELDALIVLDQVSEEECGVVTARVRDWLAERASRSARMFILADSRERIGAFRNICLKPNVAEAFKAFAAFCEGPIERYNDGAAALGLAQRAGRTVFCTLGEHGVMVASPTGEVEYTRSIPVTGPIDICGAGDSCSAGIASAMTCGVTPLQAAMFGNLVASITIQQLGTTGTATPDQVRDRWQVVSTET